MHIHHVNAHLHLLDQLRKVCIKNTFEKYTDENSPSKLTICYH